MENWEEEFLTKRKQIIQVSQWKRKQRFKKIFVKLVEKLSCILPLSIKICKLLVLCELSVLE